MNSRTIGYSSLFHLIPLPMWIYDLETFQIFDANEAAIRQYGYTKDEFLELTLKDILPEEEIQKLLNAHIDIYAHQGNINFGEFTHKKKSEERIRVDINGNKVDFEGKKCVVVVCQEVTKKIEQENQIFQSEQRFKALVQEGSDLIAILDAEGKYIYVSPTSISVLGIAPEEFIGRSPFEFIHPDDADKVLSSLQKIATEKKVPIIPFRFRNKNKEWRWIETILTNMVDNPAVKGIVANSRDITEIVNAQKQLEANELFNRSILESSPDCLKVIDTEGRLQFMNYNGMCHMEIDDFSQVQQKAWWTLWGPDNESLVKASLAKALKGETAQFTAFCPTAKGTPKWWDVLVSPVVNPGESVNQIISVSRDITKQKQEEHQLKLLSSVITHTNDAVLITEAEPVEELGRRIIYVNEAFTKMTGYTAEEVLGKSPCILQGPNSNQEELAKLGKALKNWESHEITTINYKKNGEEFWVNFTVTPVADEKGWFTHWIAIERDVTEQKNKELEKELLGEISQNFSFENDLLSASTSLCQTISDYGRFDFVELWLPTIENTHIQLFTYKSSSPNANSFYEWSKDIKFSAKGEGLPGIVWNKKTTLLWEEISKKDDFIRKEAAQKATMKSAMGIPLTFNEKIVGVLVIGSQSELKYLKKYKVLFEHLRQFIGSEINRKKLENDLQYLYDAIPVLICITDLQGRFLKINKAGCDLIGHSEEKILYNTFEKFIYPDDKESSHHDLEKLKKGGKSYGFENRYINKSGDIVWLNWTSHSNLQEGLIYATARNITEEKRLRELNRQVSKLSKIGSWEVNFANDEIIWSEMLHELHETDPKTFKPYLEGSINFYREDFKELVRQNVDKCVTLGIPFDFEAVIITAKKQERWVRAIGNAEMVNGKCQRLFGGFQDIHERKIVESQKNSLLETLEHSLNEIFIFDSDTLQFIYANKGALLNIGYSADEVKALIVPDIKADYSVASFNELIAPLITHKKEKLIFFTNHKRKDGSFYPVEVHLQLVSENNKKRFLAITLDITERIKSEEGIKDSEEKRRLIMNGAMDAIISIDINERITFWNPQSEVIFGWKETEVLGQKLSELIVPEPFRNYHVEGIKHYLETGEGNGLNRLLELSAINRSGEEFPIELTVIPIKQGGEVFFCAFIRDITQRKKAERSIIQANERFEKVTEATNDAIWDWNIINKTLYWGGGFKKLFGYDVVKNPPSVDTWAEYVHPEDLAQATESLNQILKSNNNSWVAEYRYLKEDNSYATVIDRGIVIRRADGTPVRMVGAMTDISEQKIHEALLVSMNESLQTYAKDLKRSNEELESFAFITSHDLQEPLRMISSFMDQLKLKYGDQLDKRGHQYIYFARDGAIRMRQIILDLLDYSRAGRPIDAMVQLDLNQILLDFKQLRRKIISEKSVTLSISELPTIYTCKASITQVFHSLLDNAIKYSKEGIAPHIEINAAETKDKWVFSIKDNGIGIDPEFFDKIFIIFQRLHNRHEYDGTGIGLSIAKKHVEFLEGKIWLESKLGEGSVFYFTIPKKYSI